MIKPIVFKGYIEFNNTISADTHKIRIKPEVPFTYEPGQFVTITVAPMTRRSYSIASTPGVEYIELIGDTRAGGPGSHFFASAKEGQEVDIIGPLGMFTYKQDEKPTIFWATGTGAVPFMAMIEAMLQSDKNKQIILNTSFKHEEDIFGREQFEKLASENKNFTYNLYITRPTETWKGLSGRITEYFTKLDDAKNYEHYICGVKPMVDDIIISRLKESAVPDEQVHYEKF